jgi:hypothetical protein
MIDRADRPPEMSLPVTAAQYFDAHQITPRLHPLDEIVLLDASLGAEQKDGL